MSSKTTTFACVICTALVLSPVFARAQSGSQGTDSLGDLAREQRSKNGKDGKQPTKVYTNDDFPAHPPDAVGTKKANGTANAKSDASGQKAHDEKYFRTKMDKLRANLASDNARLATLQKRMNGNVGYSPRSGGRFDQGLRDSIDSQKEKIASDEKAISDLIDQCRHEECKPGWIR